MHSSSGHLIIPTRRSISNLSLSLNGSSLPRQHFSSLKPISLNRLYSTTTNTNTDTTNINEKIKAESGSISVGILLKRAPIILKPLSEFEIAYLKYRRELDKNDAKPFPADFFFKKGTINEKKWSNALTAAEEEGIPEDKVMEKYQESEIASLKLENSKTKADIENNVKALNRALDCTLYLIVKRNAKSDWEFPNGLLEKDEVLHEVGPILFSFFFWYLSR